MENKIVGVIGASSFVGLNLLPLLVKSGMKVVAFSRQAKKSETANIEWRCLSDLSKYANNPVEDDAIPFWICVAPIWVLPAYFNLLKSYGVKRVVALSSTSRFTKGDSIDQAETSVVNKLVEAEAHLQNWAENQGVDWAIIRPTVIYGMGKDKNVAEIIRLIRRWHFFPILGEGCGLRQPVHVEDVAKICKSLLVTKVNQNRAYNISGAETLSYREMVQRIFAALEMKPRIIHLPRWVFRLLLSFLRIFPRFRHWSLAMVDRMDRDMVFDHKDAINELDFSPRPFILENRDLN